MLKLSVMEWAGYEARIGETKNTYKTSTGKLIIAKSKFGILRRRLNGDINLYLIRI